MVVYGKRLGGICRIESRKFMNFIWDFFYVLLFAAMWSKALGRLAEEETGRSQEKELVLGT